MTGLEFLIIAAPAVAFIGVLLQFSIALSKSHRVYSENIAARDEITDEEFNRQINKLGFFKRLFPWQRKKLRDSVTEESNSLLTRREHNEIQQFDREGTAWSVVVLASILSISAVIESESTSDEDSPLSGIIRVLEMIPIPPSLTSILLMLAAVAMFGLYRRRQDDKNLENERGKKGTGGKDHGAQASPGEDDSA